MTTTKKSVTAIGLDAPVLFAAGDMRAVALLEPHVPELQEFFDANPAYFLATTSRGARPDEAWMEFNDTPPPGMAWGSKWLLGFRDASGALVGMANVWSDFIAQGVWHIGLFVTASHLHGSARTHSLYQALEAWMQQQGAAWVRLGVVSGNTRPEKFWAKQGYTQVREREAVFLDDINRTVRVMAKPLNGGPLSHYLALVLRDRPEAE